MKTIAYMLIISTFLTSCVTRKRCERKFPAGIAVITKVNTITVIRDTTIYIEIPGDTVFTSVPLVEGEISKISTPLAFSYAWVIGGKLNHRLEQKDTVVPSIVKGALKTTVKDTKIQDPSIKNRGPITIWQQVQVYLGKLFLGIIAIVVVWLFFK